MDSDQTIGQTICPTSRPGAGFIELVQVAGKTAITRCRANSPLRLLTPRSDDSAARIVTASYGGGLLGGDAIDLAIEAGPRTRCLLSTQASTKIYRSDAAGSTQQLRLSAADEARVVCLPDPVVCFAGSTFRQQQRFDLSPSASFLMLDWFTSGRAARAERWHMLHYSSDTAITIAGKCVFREVLELDPRDGKIGDTMRIGPVDCFATAVMVGPAIADHARRLVREIQSTPISAGNPLLFGASQLPGAAVVRVAGKHSETVAGWLRQNLAFVTELLGMEPWQRKW